jgi:nucleotide-binding universal stress UspA family protein
VTRIVVGVDGSAESQAALRWAVDEARLRGAEVEAVHAVDFVPMGGYPYGTGVVDPAIFERAGRNLLDHAVDAVDACGLAQPIRRTLMTAGPAGAILERAQDADLVVVGSRGRGGFRGLLLGSVAHQVVQHAPCPVVVLPGGVGRGA